MTVIMNLYIYIDIFKNDSFKLAINMLYIYKYVLYVYK
jgi:hypothetical protein